MKLKIIYKASCILISKKRFYLFSNLINNGMVMVLLQYKNEHFSITENYRYFINITIVVIVINIEYYLA